jgi:hypothetical protein
MSALRAGRMLFTPQEYFWYSFLLEAESTPGAIVRLEGLGQFKNPVTSLGFEPANFRLVAKCLNQLLYRVPPPPLISSHSKLVSETMDLKSDRTPWRENLPIARLLPPLKNENKEGKQIYTCNHAPSENRTHDPSVGKVDVSTLSILGSHCGWHIHITITGAYCSHSR